MIEIRPETEADFSYVFQVNALAFGADGESRLVEKLRAKPHISLVAVDNGEVVGHIFFSGIFIEGDNGGVSDTTGLAPMSVLPEYQNRGIGSRLVRAGLKACAKEGRDAVFVLGHTNYYPKFGFEIARGKGFTCQFEVPDEYFMVLELVPGALSEKSGKVTYPVEFSGL
jgi:putative acetyltransferase